MFRKFNVYTVVVKPRRINFSRTLQLPTFIGELLVFMWQTLTNNLPENFRWVNSNPLLCRFLRLYSTLWLCFLHLNLTTTRSFLFRRWHECNSSGDTFISVRDKARHTVFSKTLSWIAEGTGLISNFFILWYCELLTALRSRW